MLRSLRHLEYIVAVARRGSLVEASGDLNVSQSAVSTAIKAWEAELGYDIFLRRPAKRLQLTPLGREFIGHASVLLEQASAFSHASRGLKESESGALAISCFSSFSRSALPPLIARLRKLHPKLELTIDEDDHPAIVRKLRRGTIQVGLTYDLARDRDIAFEPLRSSKPTVMVHAEHPLAGAPAVDLRDFVGEEYIELEMPMIVEHGLSLFAANGLPTPIMRPVKSISLLFGLVRQGIGFSIGFFAPAGKRPDEQGVVRVPIANPVPTHSVVAATYRPLAMTRRVRTVIDACRAVVTDAGLLRRGPA